MADRVSAAAGAGERACLHDARVLPAACCGTSGPALRGDLAGAGRAGAVRGRSRRHHHRIAICGPGTAGPPRGRVRPWNPDRSSRRAGAAPGHRPERHRRPERRRAPRTDAAGRTQRRCACVTATGEPVAKVRLDLDEQPCPATDRRSRLRARAAGPTELAGPPVASATEPAPRTVTVVVATRDRPELLASAWIGLRRHVCSRSSSSWSTTHRRDDQTKLVVTRLARTEPRLRYVREARAGLARAHNAALPYVRSPLVAFTDDDVVVDHRWLERMARAFGRRDDRIGCVTGHDRSARAGNPAPAVDRGQHHLRQGPAAGARSTTPRTGRPTRSSRTPPGVFGTLRPVSSSRCRRIGARRARRTTSWASTAGDRGTTGE